LTPVADYDHRTCSVRCAVDHWRLVWVSRWFTVAGPQASNMPPALLCLVDKKCTPQGVCRRVWLKLQRVVTFCFRRRTCRPIYFVLIYLHCCRNGSAPKTFSQIYLL